jgi:hypothetical protein
MARRLSLACLGLVFASLPAIAAPEPLKEGEIRKMLPGTFEASALGFVFDFTLSRNGAVLGRFGEWSDTGTWDVRDDKLCIKLKNWTSGAFRCAPILKTSTPDKYRAGPFGFRRK